MKNPESPNIKMKTSAWSPLRQAVFRSIWIATVVSNIGTWMQSVTVDDQATETHIFSFQQPGAKPFASHLIAARTYDRQMPTEHPYAELS